MASTAQELCDQILKYVKISNLNFVIAETPFSLDIKLKKKFVTSFSEPANPFRPSDQFNSNSKVERSPQSFPMDPTSTILGSSQPIDTSNNRKPLNYFPTPNLSSTLYMNPISSSLPPPCPWIVQVLFLWTSFPRIPPVTTLRTSLSPRGTSPSLCSVTPPAPCP